MNKKIISLSLAFVMLLSMSTMAFADVLDLTNIVDSEKNYTWEEFMSDFDAFDYVAGNMKDYVIEAPNGSKYFAQQIQDALDNGAESFDDAIEGLEPYEETTETELKVVGVSAINAKALKVEFNNAISEEDQAKATFDVKRGTIATTVEATWAEDGKSVELARATNLLAGTYTVTVGGLEFAEDANVGTVEVKAQKISSLEIATDNIIKNATAEVVYNAKDQYGEKMDVTVDQFTWVVVNTTDATRTVAPTNAASSVDKVLKLDTSGANANVDDVLRITGLLKSDASVKVVKEIKVSNVFVQNFELEEVVLGKDETRLNEKGTAYDVELSYSATDNYGKEVKLPTGGSTAKIGDITFVSSNEDLVKVANMATDAKSKLTFKVEANKSGKATITALNNNTGETSSIEVEVFAAVKATTVEFGEATLVEGDAKLELPVTFFDQYGEEMKADDVKGLALKAGLGFNVSYVGAGTLVATDATTVSADGKSIDLAGSTKGTYTLNLVNAKGGVSSTTVEILEKRIANELKVKTAPDASVAVGGTTDVEFKVFDQYGEEIDTFAGLVINAVSSDTNIATVENLVMLAFSEDINGIAAGNATITYTLEDGSNNVVDTQAFDVEVIAAVDGLDVAVDKTKYTAGDDIIVTIKATTSATLNEKYSKTGVASIEVGSTGNEKTYLRTVTFVNGMATTTVPATEADAIPGTASIVVDVTFDSQNDTTAAFEVKTAEASKFVLTQSTEDLVITLQDDYGNTITSFAGAKLVEITYPVAADITSSGIDAEGNALVTFANGVGTISFTTLADGDYTVTFEGFTGTLTVEGEIIEVESEDALITAIDDANPGDTIRLNSGVNLPILSVPNGLKRVTFVSNGADIGQIVIDGDGIDNVTFDGFNLVTTGSQASSPIWIDPDKSIQTLTFRNTTITGEADVKERTAIASGNAGATLVLENCRFINVGRPIYDAYKGYKELIIRNCEFNNASTGSGLSWAIAVYGSGEKKVTIDNCRFIGCKEGIMKTQGTQISAFTFTNNTMTDCAPHDPYGLFALNFTDDCVKSVSGNTADGAAFDGTPFGF